MSINTEMIDKAYEIAKWLENLRATSNEVFMPLFADTSRYLVLKGGAGSGKSYFAARKVIERCIAESGHRWLVVRKTKESIRDSCYNLLLMTLDKHYAHEVWSKTQTPMTIRFNNGSEIIFCGLNDVEHLKSINAVTGIWAEEASEMVEDDFLQLDIRMRGEPAGGYFQIILSFNPISVVHWLKKRFFDRYDANVIVSESTYKDNRFIDEQYKKLLEGYKDIDPYFYMVYCLNQWGTAGDTVFAGNLLADRIAANIQPIRIGDFEYEDNGITLSDIKFVPSANGAIKIYRDVDKRIPYVIGGDTAGDGSDQFTGQVLDNITGEQVAVLRQSYNEDLYARQIHCLGLYYNKALVAIESNFSTHPIKELERLGYPNQYIREIPDTYDHTLRSSWGFNTNSKTRPLLIADLVKAFREDSTIVSDYNTLSEMLTFVRNPKKNMRAEAESGAHDDLVMALGIAHQARGQQEISYYDTGIGGEKKTRWSDDMWHDYYEADDMTRVRITREWGEPI